MNRYILIRRLRWPAILLLAGVVALLDEMNAIDHFMSLFLPLLLILLGGLMLAERAVLSAEGAVPPAFGDPYASGPAAPSVTPYAQPTGTAIVPAASHDIEPHSDNGGQS
jgi:hypothetical protein